MPSDLDWSSDVSLPIVIYGEKAGSKLEKARKLGVPVHAEDEFLNTYTQFLESPGEPE